MKTYIAIIRGINVSGKNKLKTGTKLASLLPVFNYLLNERLRSTRLKLASLLAVDNYL